ncbi:MAG: hypothetical protein NVS4B12_07620 [Ktedonobacteraceae bacterium]
MHKALQYLLVVVGVIALIAVLVDLGVSIVATTHGNTPVRVEHVTAGPYALTLSLYKDPADAGYALPFAITAQTQSSLTYNVTSVPAYGIHATPVRAGLTPDGHNGVNGAAEIPVQGTWTLHVIVDGTAGHGEADVPIAAVAPPAIPLWLGWLIGLIPLYGLFAFLLSQRGRKKEEIETDTAVVVPENVTPLLVHDDVG